jgi:hypothetical protein
MYKRKSNRPGFLELVTMNLQGQNVKVLNADDIRTVPSDPAEDGSGTIAVLINEILQKESDAGIIFLAEAISRLRNSYRWTGGVPDIVSGQIIDVIRSDEWFQFLCEPRSNHIPLERRLVMARSYIRLALEKNFEHTDFWHELLASVPESCSSCRLLRAAGTFHVATLAL